LLLGLNKRIIKIKEKYFLNIFYLETRKEKDILRLYTQYISWTIELIKNKLIIIN